MQRYFIHSHVQRTQIRHGYLRGALYTPKFDGVQYVHTLIVSNCYNITVKTRLPAILDLFGTGGGLIEHRAALLASKGFVAFALAYFAYDDLPGNLDNFDLSYVRVGFENMYTFLMI